MARPLLVILLAAALAGSAAAATIHGALRGGLIRGTPAPDRLVGGPGPDRIAAAFGGADRVSCGRGRDVVVADLGDRVAADCEVVSRRLSVDSFADPAAQHQTAVEPAAASFGSTVVTAFQVGRYANGGAAGIGFAVSRDAGRTWSPGLLPGLGRSSDPSVAYDVAHAVWLATALAIAQGRVSVVVSRSPDGLHWSAPVTVNAGPDTDKEWIACDGGPASPFRGRCYVVFTDDGSHRVVSQSSDDGGLTWQPPIRVSGQLIGAQPLVRPDGSVVVTAVDADSRNGAVAAFRSTDGGASFQPGQRIAELQWHPPTGMRAFPLPSAAADSNGTLYVVWHDCRFRPGCPGNDLVLATSADGVTWSAPARIPLEPAGTRVDHFVPGLAADPAAPGRLALVYASFPDAGCTRETCRLGIGFASSADGGTTWSRPLRLDAEPARPAWLASTGDGRMIGDYLAAAFAAGRAVPVFALAAPPLDGGLREAIFAASLRAR